MLKLSAYAIVFAIASVTGLSVTVTSARAQDVSVAVAANFTLPLKRIAAEFEKDTGYHVLASYGATGNFYAQIRNGAPYDMLLAADEETPARLVREHAATSASQFTYAIGKLVLWSARPGMVDGAADILKKGGFTHFSVPDPKLAPYGAAGVATLKALGLYESVQPQIVSAGNVGQSYQFISTGNAELGFVALSQVLVDGKIDGSYWIVPASLYAPIRQDGVILDHGQHNPAARALAHYLQSDKARALIKSFGYDLQ